ncbi:MAG: aspartyl protease family protein [Caulobacteraceae bacterium]
MRFPGNRAGLAALAASPLLAPTPASQARAACHLEPIADLPVTMIGPRVTIAVELDGQPARMMVDSGAASSLITPDRAKALNLDVLPSRAFVRGLAGSSFASVAKVHLLSLAGTPVQDVPFVVAGNALGLGLSGVVGQNLLAIGDDEFDLAGGEIRLFTAKGCAAADLAYWAKPGEPLGEMHIKPLGGFNRLAIGEALMDGKRIRVGFDTGMPYSSLSLSAAKRLGIGPGSPGVKPVGEGTGAVGGRVFHTWIAPVASFKMGGEEIRNTHLLISDVSIPGADMLVGIDFFLSHRIFVANDLHELVFTYQGGPVFKVGGSATVEAAQGPSSPSPIEALPAPVDAAGLTRLGAALAARGDLAGASADFTRAIALDPRGEDALRMRARIFLREKRWEEARADLDRLIALAPADALARLLRAELEIRRNDKPAALADLTAADAALSPEDALRAAAGDLHLVVGDFPAAVDDFDLWMRQHPGDVGRYQVERDRCQARVLWDRDLDKAMADCQASLKKDPANAVALESRGLVHLRLGQFDAAIADFDASLAVRPKAALSLWGRGLAELRSGKTAAGDADLAAAGALDPKLPARAAVLGLGPLVGNGRR